MKERGKADSASGIPRHLRVKFVVAISVLLGVVLAANAAVLLWTNRRQLRADIERAAVGFAALATRPVCEAYETYYRSGYSKFRELIHQVEALNPDLDYLVVFDTSGRPLFDSRSLRGEGTDTPSPTLAAPTEDPQLLGAVKGLDLEHWTLEGSPASHLVVAPYIEEWGRHRYSVAYHVTYDSLNAATADAAVRISWLTGAALLLGVLFAIALAAQSLHPVAQLTRMARDLADGKLHRRINLRTGDEFEILAATFNKMAGRLANTIADLEATNQALFRSNEELKQLDRTKSDLLANVSHELRTPVTAIQGYTEAMTEGLLGSVDPEQQKALDVVQRNIHRLLGMINELLSYSRLESRAVQLEMQSFDLVAVARQIVTTLKASRGPELRLHLEVEQDTPRVYGDPYRISQVIDNLLTNAIKFTPDNGRIGLVVGRRKDEVMVEISDSGVGIPENAVGRIFDRFYQVDATSTRKFGGIGLGLAIVRQILDAHGAEIEVESEEGVGSTFRFHLPQAQALESESSGRGVRVLVIDDDLPYTQLLSAFLSRHGFEVQTASSIQQGLRAIDSFSPQIILLDRLLPDGDGFDLLAQLKSDEETRKIPVFMVSIRRERELGRRLGASGYLLKPVAPAVIKAEILEVLGSAVASSPFLILATSDERMAENLCRRLEADGLRVAVATSVDEAIAFAADEVPALLVIDLESSETAGWDLLRRVRDRGLRSVPSIVLATGRGGGRNEIPEELELVDLIEKPAEVGWLVDEITRAVKGPT